MARTFDVAVVGASISGCCAARQVAKAGHEVVVFEDDLEVGTPEKCGGLVSLYSLTQLGLPPSGRLISEVIKAATITSPGGRQLKVDATKAGVVTLRRRELDKAAAKEAVLAGAHLHVGERVISFTDEGGSVLVRTSSGEYDVDYLIDARGASVYKVHRPDGLLQAVQYECVLPDLRKATVEVLLDKELTREYFLWVIPLDSYTARVGIAGRSVSLRESLEAYVRGRGGRVLKKTFASIVVGGPLDRFVYGRRIVVGDAAGQCKPMTAGGIFTGGLGGKMGGYAVAQALSKDDPSILLKYEEAWKNKFERDFKVQSSLRKLFVELENEEIDALFDVLLKSGAAEALSDGSFDYHAINLVKLVGVKGVAESILRLGKSYGRIRSLLAIVEGK
jgi:geranylgeranyl reductase family protein